MEAICDECQASDGVSDCVERRVSVSEGVSGWVFILPMSSRRKNAESMRSRILILSDLEESAAISSWLLVGNVSL